jgi:hypothetical protein
MTKPIEIFRDSLTDIGQYAPGERENDADFEFCLRTCNDLIEQWNNENLALFAFRTQTFSLQSNKYLYTIGGVAPDIAGPRPLRIQDMYLEDATGNRLPVNLRTLSDFIALRNRMVTSQIPSDAYYDPQFPQANIQFWPTPLDPLYTVFFTSYLQLEEFADLYVDIELPAGYRPAIRYNVGVNVAPAYGKQPSPKIEQLAQMTLASLKRTNNITQPAHYDRALTRGTRSANYNIYSDGQGPKT